MRAAWSGLAVVCAVSGVWLLLPGSGLRVRRGADRVLGPATGPADLQRTGRGAGGRSGARLAVIGCGGLVTAAVAGLQTQRLVLLLVAGAAVLAIGRMVADARRDRRAETRRHQVVDYCESVVGELAAGQPAETALCRSVTVWPETEPVATAAALGADVPTALRRVARLPGADRLERLAAAWQICSTTGTGLAFATGRVLETARADQAAARQVTAELASARATARLVTALPLVVLVAAQGIGARPWSFLVDTTAGLACLVAGVGLSLVGLAWIDAIARRAVGGEGGA